MKAWTATLGVLALALSLAMSMVGLGLLSGVSGLLRETPWSPLDLNVSIVDIGLFGVILVLLAVLTAVLARGPYAPQVLEREAREARMVQDLYRGFSLMEERLESIESMMLRRVGRWSLGSKPN